MENKETCRHCGTEINIEECKTDKYWDNDGNHILYHICPECGGMIEEPIL
jgi:rRNA maturation protein Nop10